MKVNKLRTYLPSVFIISLLVSVSFTVAAQERGMTWGERIRTRVGAEVGIPLFSDSSYFNPGFGGFGSVDVAIVPFLSPALQGGFTFYTIPDEAGSSLSLLYGGLGVGFTFHPVQRLSLIAGAGGGFYSATRGDENPTGLYWTIRGEVGYRISPAVTASVHGGYTDFLYIPESTIRSASAGISIALNFDGFNSGNSRIDIQQTRLDPVFPVFYSVYDTYPFGSVDVTNGEKTAIQDVTVSFFVPDYMSQPRVCGTYEVVDQKGAVSVPLFALFNDEVLTLTENSRIQGDIIVTYTLLGSQRESRIPVKLSMFHRNAMTWDDDRKAASFVSPTDPAVLWFSRFAAGIVRDRMRNSISPNLQLGMGMFEALNYYGINYVIDPNSSYVELSSADSAIDYLQFPHQTLLFRGGDCDDLSILYSALMESIGIRTGFITIPGHIYMAFTLDMSEEEARKTFYDPGMLIYIDGEAWLPLEITMVKEGFNKAWRIGAKEWHDNIKSADARFYPMSEAWKLYRPAAIPNVDPRFSLPEETAVMKQFDKEINRFVAREIIPQKELLLADTDMATDEQLNKIGILYGRYAMLQEAWEQFSAAAEDDYSHAWTNLGNVSFLQKNYELAVKYYSWALKLDSDDTAAILGLSRSYYELEKLQESDDYYTRLREKDPGLADEYSYLASLFGGEGRAWSFTDRLTRTVWSEPENISETPEQIVKETVPEKEPSLAVMEDTSESGSLEKLPIEEISPEAEAVKPAATAETAAEPDADTAAEATPAKEETVLEEERITEATTAEPEINKEEAAAETEAPPVIALTVPEETEPEETAAAEEALTTEETSPKEPEETERPGIALTVPEETEPEEAVPPAVAITVPEEAESEEAPAAAELPAVEEPSPAEPAAEEPAAATLSVPVETEPAETASAMVKDVPEESEPEEKPAVVIAVPEEPAAAGQEGAEKTAAEEKEVPVAEWRLESWEEALIAQALAQEFARPKIIVESFADARPGRGDWSVTADQALQKEPEELFAKLVLPVHQAAERTRYTFSAQSTGLGWSGTGIHIFRGPVESHLGYGEGKSILIWMTSDPVHNDDEETRLQVYRSLDDINMILDSSVVIPESNREKQEYEILMDSGTGTVTVYVNGIERLKTTGFDDFTVGEYVVFRSLGMSLFENVRIEEIPEQPE